MPITFLCMAKEKADNKHLKLICASELVIVHESLTEYHEQINVVIYSAH